MLSTPDDLPVVCGHTARLRLRPFRKEDRAWFAALHADVEVMRDYGGPLHLEESDRKLDRYIASGAGAALGRLAVETKAGEPVGYTGVMSGPEAHPLGHHLQIGWRLLRHAWGRGFASEAATEALAMHFARQPADEVLAYTAADNSRSQAVMVRLHLRRDPDRDFTAVYPGAGAWRGLVWVADAAAAPRWT